MDIKNINKVEALKVKYIQVLEEVADSYRKHNEKIKIQHDVGNELAQLIGNQATNDLYNRVINKLFQGK